ncbi:MAG: hypothetical protein AAF533_00435 [Acidobacteriota bacterium]
MKTTSLLTLATLVAFVGPALAQVGGTTGPSWPLPLPPPGSVLEMDDLHGAIVHLGGQDYQVDTAVLLMSPEGHFGFHHLSGYDSEGQPLSFTRPDDGSQIVESLDELDAAVLGDPAEEGSLVQAEHLVLGIDGLGQLVIAELTGVQVETGERLRLPSVEPEVDPLACRVRIAFSCHDASCPTECVEPACVCPDQPTGCYPYSRPSCYGFCPDPGECCRWEGPVCECRPRPDPSDRPPVRPRPPLRWYELEPWEFQDDTPCARP